jgi:AdoMet-dependent rRNA methyltransferase SPB1
MKSSKFFDRKVFKEGLKSEAEGNITLVNPIKLEKVKKNKEEIQQKAAAIEREEFGSDSDDVDPEEKTRIHPNMRENEKRKRKLRQHQRSVNKKVQEEEEDDDEEKKVDLKAFEDDSEEERVAEKAEKHKKKYGIEIVPELRYDDYDIDAMAEMRVLAHKMLRKKDRDEIIDESYNRYNRPVDEDAPEWFLEDERRHNFKHLPITKEEYRAEKERLMALHNKAPKKVIQ